MTLEIFFSGDLGHSLRRFSLGDHNIRVDALLLDGASLGRVVARHGELEARAVFQINDGLHRALAEGAPTQDHGPLVVLQSAGDDLRGRSGAAVDQADDGDAGPGPHAVGALLVQHPAPLAGG